jgi:uncharacterized membrane protein
MSVSIHSASRWNRWTLVPTALSLAAVSVPYLLTHRSFYIGFALQHAFALICHQRPERSFWIFGAPVAVCSRCLGIYLGATIGLLFRTSRRVALQSLIAATMVNLADWSTEFAGLHGNWIFVRFFLGLALGAAAALLIASSMRVQSIETTQLS